jgi:SAM-dependent methyltransferase
MPPVSRNLSRWDQSYTWPNAGDEWSAVWGGPEAQWFFVIYPRIHLFLPAATILEIAPGHGRWTHFLRQYCDRFVGVDLSPECVEACRRRFADWTDASFEVNDGYSLAMVADRSVDFAFSFDSLVHAEWDVMASYLSELSRVLSPGGVAFLHHSHMGAHTDSVAGRFTAHVENRHWRALNVSGSKVEEECRRVGLRCVSQERVNWGEAFISDCMSTIVRAESPLARDCVVVDNPEFMREATHVARVSRPYVNSALGPVTDDQQTAGPRPTLGRRSLRGLIRRLAGR